MRCLIPVWIAGAISLTACAPRVALESATDGVNTVVDETAQHAADALAVDENVQQAVVAPAVEASTQHAVDAPAVEENAQQVVAAPSVDAPAQQADAAPAEEVRFATGISLDVCKLPKFTEMVEIVPSSFAVALLGCFEEDSSMIEIGIREQDIYINIVDSGLSVFDDSYLSGFNTNDADLIIFQMHISQDDTLKAFIKEHFYRDQRGEFKMEKDQVMTDRHGYETFKVTYRINSETAGGDQVEGYCFDYGYEKFCVAARSRGSELIEFRDAFFANMKLVTKTESEIAKEQEEKLRKQREERKESNARMIENYGGVPQLKMKNPEVNGKIDKRIIQKVVRQHGSELRTCYEKALSKTKGITGRIVVHWEIDAGGAVSKSEVKSSTFGNPALENCFTESIKQWRFPSPKDGGTVLVDYPFVLELQTEIPEA